LGGIGWNWVELEVLFEGRLETIWEKLFFSWEFLGTFDIGYQYVIKINGNFVGITFENVGKTIGKIN
jgi:hypothetical protein